MPKKITDEHPSYTALKSVRSKTRAVLIGESAIKGAGKETYLPRPPSMRKGDRIPVYDDYLERAIWYEVTSNTQDGLTGIIWRQPPLITGTDELLALVKTLPLGMSYDNFAQMILMEQIGMGLVGSLTSRSQDANSTAGPHWAMYKVESIINWETSRIDDNIVLSRVVLVEKDSRGDDFTQIRELFLDPDENWDYTVRIWRQPEKNAEHAIADQIVPRLRGESMKVIPFTFFGAKNLDPKPDKPPMAAIANLNIQHFRLQADLMWTLHLQAQPTLVGIGVQEGEEPPYWGPGVFATFSNPQAKILILEVQGPGIAATQTQIAKVETQMINSGAQWIPIEKAGVEAVETVKMRSAAHGATVSTISETFAGGLEQQLKFAADWANISTEITVKSNQDFMPVPMSAEDAVRLVSTWLDQAIPYEELVRLFQKGEILSRDKTADEFRAMIETESRL